MYNIKNYRNIILLYVYVIHYYNNSHNNFICFKNVLLFMYIILIKFMFINFSGEILNIICKFLFIIYLLYFINNKLLM